MDYHRDFYEGYAQTAMGKLHYLHHDGQGKSIVFMHGLGASSLVWQKLVAFLPDAMDVYLLDLLGHGDSDKPRIKYNIGVQVNALKEFVSSFTEPPYLFGHSYGGWIAARYASIVKGIPGIILEDPAGLKQYFLDIQNNVGEERYKEKMLKNLLSINGNERYVMESILDEDTDKSGWLDETLLSRIACKCLILWGSSDKVIDIRYAGILNSAIAGSKMEIVDGANHEPHYTNPDKVADIIASFTR
ncbi:MAG: alpha/beta hydrolase [Candidatus Micrarchaeaceae archaeon]